MELTGRELDYVTQLVDTGNPTNIELAEIVWGKGNVSHYIYCNYDNLIKSIGLCNGDVTNNFINLMQVKVLDFGGFGMQHLSSSIGNLTNLKKLRLEDNYFPSIPSTILNLHNLEELILTNCGVKFSEEEKAIIRNKFPFAIF